MKMDGSCVLLAAHRGDQCRFPENTMPAFRSALAAGVDMIETDVHMTADGALILMHDRSALRTAGVNRDIGEMTLKEVRELNAAHGFEGASDNLCVPTVREFLDWVRGTDLSVNWELKDYPRDVGDEKAFRCADLLIEQVTEAGMENRSMMNSFSARVLEHIREKCGRLFPIHGQGIGTAPRSVDSPRMPPEELFDWCCLYPAIKGEPLLNYPENFTYCTSRQIIPCVCIPDTEENIGASLRLGCKMFTSNNIYEADRILKLYGARG